MKTKTIKLFIFIISSLFFSPCESSFSLEKLTNTELASVTAQSGISAFADDVVLLMDSADITFQDIGTLDSNGDPVLDPSLNPRDGYLTFNVNAMVVFNDAVSFDVGVFQQEEQLSFTDNTASGDVTRLFDHPLNNFAMLDFTHEGYEHYFVFEFNDIRVYNHEIDDETLLGDLVFTDLQIFESRFNAFPPPGDDACGIMLNGGIRGEFGHVEFTGSDGVSDLTVSGVMLGSSFSGDPLPDEPNMVNEINTDSWTFDEGLFQVGIPYYFKDIPGQDDTEIYSFPFAFNITTEDGRSGDFQSYIALDLPLQGSLRIKNIHSHGTDFGPIAIDGIRLYKNVIEFPGRGIGH